MDVNEMQIGGNHYRKKYQHWDFVCDTNMPYVLGCATKYIARWREKNGIEDLKKSVHYIHKALSRGIYMPGNKWWQVFGTNKTEDINLEFTKAFVSQLQPMEAHIIRLIVEGSYKVACQKIADIVDNELHDYADPGPAYTNQDLTYFRG